MAGGLLNLIAIGNQNIILNSNPNKSFFKSKYNKYTNFGLEKYRIDQQGQTNIDLNKESLYKFKISRYGDLLIDAFLVINLPKIWSPIFQYTNYDTTEYRPYEFQWIKNIGCQIIKEISITIGSQLIQKFSGSYLQNMIARDYDNNKKELFDILIGNVKQLNDPANYSNRNNNYPNAYKLNNDDNSNIHHSINSYQLYIPINTWFSNLSSMAVPLCCLQYAEMEINFILNPITKLFTIKDVLYDTSLNNIINYDDIPRIKSDQNNDIHGFYRFIQEPPIKDISSDYQYKDKTNKLNFDIHLITTQCFLDNNERSYFVSNTQNYLIKIIYEYEFTKLSKSSKIKLDSYGLVSNWMWFLQRDDVNLRNEWSNYTNWPYENKIPNTLQKLTTNSSNNIYYPYNHNYSLNDSSKNIYITGNEPDEYNQKDFKEILKDFAIICDGKYRENSRPSGIFNKIEKFTKTNGNSNEFLYNYAFCLNTDYKKYQPDGAFNTNKFKNIEFEYNLTSNPPINPDASNVSICDPETREIIGVVQDPTNIYKYNYNMYIYEERYNVLSFQSGLADLIYNR
jgi:hypothetical protein